MKLLCTSLLTTLIWFTTTSFICFDAVKINNCDKLKSLKSGHSYVVKGTIDLKGAEIKIPANCTFRFSRGLIKNGKIVFDNTRFLGKRIKFQDIIVDGTIDNKTVCSSWFQSTQPNNNILVDAIKLACNSNVPFVFEKGSYLFTEPIYLYGKGSLLSKGKVFIHSTGSPEDVFILAGAISVGGKVVTWEGAIKGLSFIADSGRYNYYLGLLNVENCEVSNCEFDMSKEGVDCRNKVIGSVNNANYVNPSRGSHIRIINNRIIIQESLDNRNNCESIGIENREDVLIEGNVVLNERDDLGIHNSRSVIIRNNKVTSYNGRIYVSNSKDVEICNNELSYVFPSTTGMGIFVGYESGYDQISERILIDNNRIDYSLAQDTPCYGIRIIGANDVTISNNVVTGQKTCRIAIESITAKASQNIGLDNKGILVPKNIRIEKNETNGLWVAGFADYVVKDITIVNNVIKGYISITNKNIKFQNNIIERTATLDVAPTPQLNILK